MIEIKSVSIRPIRVIRVPWLFNHSSCFGLYKKNFADKGIPSKFALD
jgi:hypothetical protein